MTLTVRPVEGLPQIDEGADLAELIAGAERLEDADVVVVTQKAVSKAEGRVVPDTEGKDAWVRREARRVVARRGDLIIAETRHGFVCASAGVDASNVARGFLSLLPEDPDESAARLRRDLLRRTGREVGVVITDTFGRPWRRGLVEVAIGCAGFPALFDLRGTKDLHGRVLESTVLALADEVAAAAGLVMGKAQGTPVAVVRGITVSAPAGTAGDLVRDADEDLFRHSPLHAITSRRTVRAFGPGPVARRSMIEAVSAALTAPIPHGSRHARPPWLWVVMEGGPARRRLLAAMGTAWERDLRADGVGQDIISRRRARSEALLGEAPALAVPALTLRGADAYRDERRRTAERDMFVLATGAAVQNFMLALHAQGVASSWISSTLFCGPEAAEALGLEEEWLPMGAVAIGPPPPGGVPERPPTGAGANLRWLDAGSTGTPER